MSRVYKKTFSRDFSLATVEIWWRGEALNPKQWTDEKQPFQPYIVFEKTPHTVHCWYDPEGIMWSKSLLLSRVSTDPNFLPFLQEKFLAALASIRHIYEDQPVLSHQELCTFLDTYEKAWPWFEAVWWIWETPDEKLPPGAIISETFRRLRDVTQDFVPGSDSAIRKSLAQMYPQIGERVHLLTIQEIVSQKFPSIAELAARERGYFFTDNAVYVGKTRADIEKAFSISFQILQTSTSSEVRGTPAYSGKVSGPVRLVYGIKDIAKVTAGDILVAPMTLPDIMPAMQKAAAFVTDEGGIACHAAIIAREMKKPCVVGTKVATEVFKDGDVVEVDAEKGLVAVIKRGSGK